MPKQLQVGHSVMHPEQTTHRIPISSQIDGLTLSSFIILASFLESILRHSFAMPFSVSVASLLSIGLGSWNNFLFFLTRAFAFFEPTSTIYPLAMAVSCRS